MPAPSNIQVAATPDFGNTGDVIVVAVTADGEVVTNTRWSATNVLGAITGDVIITQDKITYAPVDLPAGWTAVERPDEPGVFDVTIG